MGHRPRTKPKYLPKKLLAVRQRLGLSQPALAKQLIISSKRISEFESGRREPDLIILLAYARLADIPLESLIDDELVVDNLPGRN
jgi:transcriptional regulator with XRE-family HTH domain